MTDRISLEEFKHICRMFENVVKYPDSLDAKIIRLLDEGKL